MNRRATDPRHFDASPFRGRALEIRLSAPRRPAPAANDRRARPRPVPNAVLEALVDARPLSWVNLDGVPAVIRAMPRSFINLREERRP